MSISGSNQKPPHADNVFTGILRGVQGRSEKSSQPHLFFETAEAIAAHGFKDNSADIFLGVVNGNTVKMPRDDGRDEYCTLGGALVGVRDDRHILMAAGSRSGKGRSLIINNLRSYGGSCIVIDPKGENARHSAAYRDRVLKQNVFIIDPFRTTPAHCAHYRKHFDPLFILKRSGKNPRIEDAALIADAIVVSGKSEDAHWDESAKAFIQGLLLHVVSEDSIADDSRTIIKAADLVSGKLFPFETLLAQMSQNKAADGRIIAAARTMEERSEREQSIVLSVVRRNFNFLEPDPLRHVLSAHDVDLDDLKAGNTTIYIVLPAMRLNSCKQFLRLFINLTLESVESTRKPLPQIPTLMILDEFAILGRMAELENAIGQIAGYKLRIWTILQDIGQLRALYGERAETFIGNSGVLIFFGIVDYLTSEWISKYLDRTTITVASAGTSIASQYAHGGQSENKQQVLTDLMTPAEVRYHFARDDPYNRQLILIPGKKPWIMQRVNYDKHPFFKNRDL